MDENYCSEKFNSIRNEMSHIWGAIFVTGGGVATIFSVSNWTYQNIFLFIVGFIMTVMFVNAYIIRKLELMDMLKKIKKGEKL